MQTNKKLTNTDNRKGVSRGEGGGGKEKKVKGGKYMATEGDGVVCAECTTKYTDVV